MPVLSPPPIQESVNSEKWVMWFIQINEILSLMSFAGENLVFNNGRTQFIAGAFGLVADLAEQGVHDDTVLHVSGGSIAGEAVTPNYNDIVFAAPGLGMSFVTSVSSGSITKSYGTQTDSNLFEQRWDFTPSSGHSYRITTRDPRTIYPLHIDNDGFMRLGSHTGSPVNSTHNVTLGPRTHSSTSEPLKMLIFSQAVPGSSAGGATTTLEFQGFTTTDNRELGEIIFSEGLSEGSGGVTSRIWGQGDDISASDGSVHIGVGSTEVERFVVDKTLIQFNGMATDDLDIVDAKTTSTVSGTAAGYIQVQVAGNTHYIRLYPTTP